MIQAAELPCPFKTDAHPMNKNQQKIDQKYDLRGSLAGLKRSKGIRQIRLAQNMVVRAPDWDSGDPGLIPSSAANFGVAVDK